MSGRRSTPWITVGVGMAACALGFLTLVAIGSALLGGGNDISRPGPFRAEEVAALPDGGIAVVGTGGMCGDLLLVRVAPDGAQRKTSVKAGKLGGDCVDGIASVTVWRGGIDVLAEPASLQAPSGAAIAFGRAGRVLVLRNRDAGGSVRPTVIATGSNGSAGIAAGERAALGCAQVNVRPLRPLRSGLLATLCHSHGCLRA